MTAPAPGGSERAQLESRARTIGRSPRSRALTALSLGLLVATVVVIVVGAGSWLPLTAAQATGLAALLGALAGGITFRAPWPKQLRDARNVPDVSRRRPERDSSASSEMPRRVFLLPLVGGLAGLALGRLWSQAPRAAGSMDAGQRYWEASKLPARAAGVPNTSGGQNSRSFLNLRAVALPAPPRAPDLPLAEAIERRRSVRAYGERPLTLQEVSRLLYAAQGLTQRAATRAASLRAAPSAGALYPIEVYLAAFKVAGMAQGIHSYDPGRDQLNSINFAVSRDDLAHAGLGQEALRQAAAVLILTGIPARLQQKYGNRSHRYMLMEAGHVSENVYLSATALGLGVCGIGAFADDELNGLLGVDGRDELSLFLLAVGAR